MAMALLRFAFLLALSSSLAGANLVSQSPTVLLQRAISQSYETIDKARHLILTQIDNAMNLAEMIKTRELIMRYMSQCEAINDISYWEYFLEVLKYWSLTHGGELRRQEMEECYEELRPRVTEAWEKGYITPMYANPCKHGWGSFNLGRQRILYITEMALPCLKPSHKPKEEPKHETKEE